ncbi:MAG: SulP family inorganic anion transporter [Gammaproteobacteria bacterium]|nr:SulP family inorganic anion transporter [Gammaproteobacteria bacterium]NNJ85318.1 SulP family inorganic anion transporter [Gammaproteobacteria bacterium]
MLENKWHRVFPFLLWWPNVDKGTFRADFLAGISNALLTLPQGIAFAAIAGMPIQYGLYAGMVPAVIAALFGSSWHLVSGPTTAASIVIFSSLSALAEPGSTDYVSLALTLTFMVGIVQLGLGFARIGTLVNFISHSVIVGFTAGAALMIAASQARHFFGIELPHHTHLYETVQAIILNLHDIDPTITAIGILTVLGGVLSNRFLPWIPYMISAIVIGVSGTFFLAHWPGLETVSSIPMTGALPASLPPLSAPDFSLDTIRQLAPVTLAMTLFALTEATSIGRSLAARSGQNLDGNQEFIGQGLSNIAGSFFSAYVATGSFNRSAANYAAGAKTPMAAIFSGLFLMAIIIPMAPLVAYLPNAVMAGVLFLVAVTLVDSRQIKSIIRTSRSETLVLVVTFSCTLMFDLTFAILMGVILSLVVYLARTSHPPVLSRVPNPNHPRRALIVDPQLPECSQLKIVSIEGSLFFGAVHHVHEHLRQFERENPKQKHLAITAIGINFGDVAGTELLAREAKTREEHGGALYLIRPKSGLLTPLRRGGHLERIGEGNVFLTKQEAIATITSSRLDPNICAVCTQRIFLECASLPGANGVEPKRQT